MNRLIERDGLLWAGLIVQIVFYWAAAFLMSTGNELVAYQRY